MMAALSAGGQSGTTVVTSVGGPVSCWRASSVSELPWYGSRPASIW